MCQLFATDQEYHGIDMANAYPRVLLYLAKGVGVSVPNLIHYVGQRSYRPLVLLINIRGYTNYFYLMCVFSRDMVLFY